ncbi:helix-turn-helix transcriptional regulator [Myxococcus stipitatus]|uniref:helix-turn-helix transcriptional regulator n=1 Tax=Myxococcus stipitatus TaxID=83455 RepID=UPI00314506C6
MNRNQLAEFLRNRRERLSPRDAGLPPRPRRRTPGLRREEVAQLADISVDYYCRLEQARGPHPSRQVLEGLSRALRLLPGERAHLFQLAGETAGPPASPPQSVSPGIQRLLEHLDEAAAVVLDAKYDVLAWNALASALMEDFSRHVPRERNLLRRYFLRDTSAGPLYGMDGRDEFEQFAVGHLRAAAARYPEDASLQELIQELLAGSVDFTRVWSTHPINTHHGKTKRVRHPLVGDLTLNCEVLLAPEQDQHVVIYTAEPGTPSHRAFQRLKSLLPGNDQGEWHPSTLRMKEQHNQ